MICVSIAQTELEEILRLLEGVSMAEVRLEKISGLDEKAVEQIFDRPARLIAACRPGEGRAETEREKILLQAIQHGAAFVDIEMETAEGMRKRIEQAAHDMDCQIIISFHDFEKMPASAELEKIKNTCFAYGADIAKLACRAENEEEAQRMLDLCEKERFVIPIAMGGAGVEQRAAIVLTVYGGHNHAETATILGCSEATVSWRIFSARRKLKKILSRKGAGHE